MTGSSPAATGSDGVNDTNFLSEDEGHLPVSLMKVLLVVPEMLEKRLLGL